MKINKRLIAVIMALVMVINFSVFGSIQVFAHSAMLDIEYDNCTAYDSNNEMWYILLGAPTGCYHLSHNTDTIKYYFEETSLDGTYTWTTDVSESVAQEIKDAYANSMKKWNNVYFYSYNDDGTITKKKIINVVEGTATDHNLSIYPYTSTEYNAMAITTGNSYIIESGEISHKHYFEWIMIVYVNNFYANDSTSEYNADLVRERTGAHELGHVLGLGDIDADDSCNANAERDHHNELLMGYGEFDRASDITYKDIAGTAITRGFHTDDDHKWLNAGLQSDGTYKLICSICNGVKYVEDLSNYTYDTYGACNSFHSLLRGNMMAAASYGNQDYYKCKYCRYVAKFSKIQTQNYVKTQYTDPLHKCENNVDGLRYSFYENHTFVNDVCTGCGFSHDHTYGRLYMYYNNREHRKTCSCTSYIAEAHYVRQSEIVDSRYATCLGCRTLLDLYEDYANSILSNIVQVSANGSYILSNGIVILVDEDVQGYIDGTLQFYHPDSIPESQ